MHNFKVRASLSRETRPAPTYSALEKSSAVRHVGRGANAKHGSKRVPTPFRARNEGEAFREIGAQEFRVDGTLVWPPRGIKGFGYDPVFQPTGLAQTFGEIEPERKHAMSHRAQAFHKLVAACFS